MSLRRARGAVLAGLAAGLLAAGGANAAPGAGDISVAVDRTEISTKLGHKFFFRSTITNRGSTAASGLIAHLNVLSLRSGVYVDPEDWSTNRTRYLKTIPAGGSTTITWRMQAVNPGELGVYIAVLAGGGSAGAPVTGPAIHLSVASRRTLNSGGILPLALGIPGFLGLLILGMRFRRTRA